MVSLPSFLAMAEENHSEELHLLGTMKGQLSSFVTQAIRLMGTVGELPAPVNTRHGEHFDKWGEILYKLTVITAYTAKDLEELTNELRVRDGKRPLDYSDSFSSRVLKEWLELMKEQAPKFGVSVTDEGKLVRS